MNKKNYIIILLLFALFFFTGFSEIDPLPKGTITLTNSSQETLNKEIEEVLLSFYTSYYDSLANLKEIDLTSNFNIKDPHGFEESIVNQGILQYMIGHRKFQLNDLTMKSYLVEIEIDSIKNPAEGSVEISLKEHSKINFNFIPDIDAQTSSIKQNFQIQDTEDGWKIQEFSRNEDINYLIKDMYIESKERTRSTEFFSKVLVDKIVSDLLEQSELEAEERRQEKEIYNSRYDENVKPFYNKTWKNDYNRLNAVAYANQWVGLNSIVRNPRFFVYDDLGGNCANYTSQCILAGGIPMDHQGSFEKQWKWYSNAINGKNTARGRTSSWAGVNQFYNYVKTNTGFGLVSHLDDNHLNGEIGDVILFGTDTRWKHAVIITDVIKDVEGRIIDFLINSNTTDRKTYPLSAYSYSNIQLVKILGWNN